MNEQVDELIKDKATRREEITNRNTQRMKEWLKELENNQEALEHAFKANAERFRMEGLRKSPRRMLETLSTQIEQFTNPLTLAHAFTQVNPLWYDRSLMWWAWNHDKLCWEITDETDILIQIDNALKIGITTKSSTKNEILEALRREARRREPETPPKTWVQFKQKIIDVSTGEQHEPSPKWFVTNPLPYAIGECLSTPILDSLLTEWVGEEYVQTLKQIAAYCCLSDYPLHRIFVLIGSGTNGKSTFLRFLSKFLGTNNTCSTELDVLITNRFETAKLHKKLLCQLGETNFTELKQTSLLKRLSGGDLIGFEYKNKMPFDEYNYAKIIIATNNLPQTHDKTIGFYRRWVIIDFPNQFRKEEDILSKIPEEEYEAFAAQSVLLLQEILNTRKFSKQGSIEDRQKRYEEKSNPLSQFIRDYCVLDLEASVPNFEFRDAFQKFCSDHGFNILSHKIITQGMKQEGFESERRWFGEKQYRAYIGIRLKGVTDVTDVTLTQLGSCKSRILSEVPVTSVTSVTEKSDWVLIEALKDIPSIANPDNIDTCCNWGDTIRVPQRIANALIKKGYACYPRGGRP